MPPEIPDDSTLVEGGKSTGSSVIEPNSVAAEDGRTYHGYDEGSYLLPNDGPEQDRLDLQHAMSTLLINKKFGLAPLRRTPNMVLDIATGTGIWALEFARQHPDSYVIGTDLSLIQPATDVLNCEFVRENSETSDWVFPKFFDYIHARFTITCFNDTKVVMRKAFDHLQPGGWVEFYDSTAESRLPDGSARESAFLRWLATVEKSLRNVGRDVNKARFYKEWLLQIGFVGVHEEVIWGPMTPWPDDPKLKQVGMFARADAVSMVNAGQKLLSSAGLTPEKISELQHQCTEELLHGNIRVSIPFYIVYGRKPFEHEMTGSQKRDWELMQEKVSLLRPSYPTP